jgi:hypothetical protein
MTAIFIYIIFGAIIAFDIGLLIRKEKTITSVFRHWYESFIFVPFTVGVLFLGHFLSLMPWTPPPLLTILGLSITGSIMLILSIVFTVKKIIIKPRVLILLFIALGYLVGDVCW